MSTSQHIIATPTAYDTRVVCGEEDAFIARYKNRNPGGRYFEVCVHGGQGADGKVYAFPIVGGQHRPISPKQLAAFIRRQPGYRAGCGVRLIMCMAGFGGLHSFAQQLADELRDDIIAATGQVSADTHLVEGGIWGYFSPQLPRRA